MNPAEKFRHHAFECRRMARAVRDFESKAAWRRMAERWVHCAELEEARPASRRAAPRHRHSPLHADAPA